MHRHINHLCSKYLMLTSAWINELNFTGNVLIDVTWVIGVRSYMRKKRGRGNEEAERVAGASGPRIIHLRFD